jgi:uncharacterized membrane protein YidH (DUF202 family)
MEREVPEDYDMVRIGTSVTGSRSQQGYNENATLQSEVTYWRNQAEKQTLRADANLAAWREAKALAEVKSAKYKELLHLYEDTVAVANQRRIDLAIARTDLILEQQSHAETRDSLLSAQRTIQRLNKDNEQLTTDLTAANKDIRNLIIGLVIIITAILIGALLYWLDATGRIDLKEFLKRKPVSESALEVT